MEPYPVPDPAPAADAVTFGRFQLRRVLGQGGMGIVQLAFDPLLQREVALKLLRPELLATPTAHRRFEQEALAAARLDHPSLCPVYEVGTLAGQPFLVMPYLRGETLAERFARAVASGAGPGTADRNAELLHILAQIAHALHYAHGLGLTHRDVKPGNILVQPDGPPVLLDFGLAREIDGTEPAPTRSGHSPGTPLYMAPEQLRHGTALDARVDVYGLGVTLYEGLTLQPPFRGRTLYELHRQILDQPPPDPPPHNRSVSRDLRAVVAKATAKEPAHRYASCRDFALDLERCRRGEPIQARPLPARQRAWYWVRRHPAASTLLLVLSIALGITVAMGRANAALATELAARAATTTQQRRDAEHLQQLVTARIERFELLATAVQVAAYRSEGTALQASGTLEIAALRDWLDRFDRELRPQLERVERALRPDRAASGAPVEAAATLPAATRARLAELEPRRTALRAAVANAGQPLPPQPPAALLTVPDADLPNLAMAHTVRHCAPGRPLGAFGREAEFLASTRRLLELEPDEAKLPVCQALHAWALSANGFDPEAQQLIAAASAAAPEPLRMALQWTQHQVARAARDRLQELAHTEATYQHFASAPSDAPPTPNADPADLVLRDALQRARFEFSTLTAPGGLHAQVQQVYEWATASQDLTEHHPGATVSWADAAAAIAAADGIGASTRYREVPIALRPQTGLVPIGMNPVTQLWEFYDLRSALERPDPAAARRLAIPRHRPDGSLDLAPDAGLVFVLVPGGATTIGAQRGDPQAPHYDAAARADEPLRTGPVAPYLLARHELTQAQWRHLDPALDELSARDPDPSAYREGVFPEGRWITCRHPVENVSWRDATARLAMHGLRLPDEWEWERACRAGSTAAYGREATAASLAGYENLLDESTRKNSWQGERVPFDDGYVLHAPVGSYRANAFGMYDMLGNVAEFCRDRFASAGERIVVRGGCCSESALAARAAARIGGRPDSRGFSFGLRAARELR